MAFEQDSPMNRAFNEFDLKHIDWFEKDYIRYAVNVPFEENNSLLKDELKWRFDHGMNFVASWEGYQGTGKSMSASYCGLYLGSVYGEPFSITNIHFLPEELDEAIQKSKPKQTFIRDEHKYAKIGLMSNMIAENLADYEDQLRRTQNNLLFCSVNLQNHAHFFCFESKHIVFDENKYPVSFISILKTPRYTNKNQFVWRGYVSFPMPNKDFVEAYLKRKDEHIENLKRKWGNTLSPVDFYSRQVFEKREHELIVKTKLGLINPIKESLMQFVISKELGTSKFTVQGYKYLTAKLKSLVVEKYKDYNDSLIEQMTKIKQEIKQKKEETELGKEKIKVILLEKKLELMEQRNIELKRRNDLKQFSLDLKKKETENLK